MLLIEYDGLQHFQESGSGWGHSLADVKEKDDLKNNYAALNKIPLLRISYLDYDKIEVILNDTIEE